MDNQEGEMRTALHGTGIIVARTGNDLLLNIRSDSLFEPESLSLSAHGAELLAHLATVVHKFDSTLLVANGFTDTTGSRAQNLVVSQKRADAVVKQLADDGVDQKRLAAKGFGDEILKIPTGPNVSEARNRRIEIRTHNADGEDVVSSSPTKRLRSGGGGPLFAVEGAAACAMLGIDSPPSVSLRSTPPPFRIGSRGRSLP
jgi:hypothetical protein